MAALVTVAGIDTGADQTVPEVKACTQSYVHIDVTFILCATWDFITVDSSQLISVFVVFINRQKIQNYMKILVFN